MTAKKGRPSKFTAEMASRICERLAAGETLRAVCRDEDMPSHPTVLRWVHEKEGFSDQYAKARETGYAVMADELLEIADDGSNDTTKNKSGEESLDAEWMARSRLRVDTRKWLLSKALPKIYGDKLDVQHGGSEPLLEALAAAGERARNVRRD